MARALAVLCWSLRELGIALAVLLGVTLLLFAAVRLAPKESVGALSVVAPDSRSHAPQPSEQPSWHQEFRDWLAAVVRGDFGRSDVLQRGRAVRELIAPAALRSLALALAALSLSVGVAFVLAVHAVKRPHARRQPFVDGGMRLLSVVPVFLYVYLLVAGGNELLLWAARGGLLELPGWFPYPARDAWVPWLLTATVLAVGDGLLMDLYGRFRGELDHAARADHLAGARLLGLPLPLMILMGALPGMVSHLSRRLAFVLGSLVVVESAVAWPGLGYLAWRAAAERDLPVLLGVALVMAVVVRLGWVLADVARCVFDPRGRAV